MKKVSFIGSGNVATHLAKGLYSKGVDVYQVYSKSIGNAEELAEKVDALAIQSLACLNLHKVDLLIIAIKDDIIENLANSITSSNTIVVHTSGTQSLDVLKEHRLRGVFYPLQTFSKQTEMDLTQVPFCIESNDTEVEGKLINWACMLSNDVRVINADTRKEIHLAAVVACNFTNHMFALAEELLEESNADFSILKPLIQETVAKAMHQHPKEVQTGPAVRGDNEVIKNHLERLESNPNLQTLYSELSNSIIKLKNE
jgi:predicted short-subunit dehydrogenase-like oxidoreductase (DUF2520 family)